jgi:hypothetical protein
VSSGDGNPVFPLLLANNFEGGTNGTTISTSNSGGSSGHAFDVVTISATAALAYSNTTAAHGLLSMVASTGATAGQALAEWSRNSVGFQVGLWGRAYINLSGYPTSADSVVSFINGATVLARIQVTGSGKIALENSPGSNIVTFTTVIPKNQWVRVEFSVYFPYGTANGSMDVRLYLVQDSLVITEEHAFTGLNLGSLQPDEVLFGWAGAADANQPSMYMDDLQVNNVTWPGPVLGSPPAPGLLGPYVFRSPPPRRARTGSGGSCAGGVAGPGNATVVVYQRPAPQIPHPAPRRAVWRGLASRISTPLGSLTVTRPVFPRRAPQRAITGSNLACGDGQAGPGNTVTPLACQRRAASRGAPRRALWHGLASAISTPLGSPGPRLPLEARSPAPRRAVWRGLASRIVTPLGSPGPRLPLQARSPAPRRARAGAAGLCAAGVLAPFPPPQAPLPHPVIQHIQPRRAVTRGLASPVPTPLGSPGPRLPLEARSPAPRRVTWRGLASRVVTPLGASGPRLPLEARSPAPRRALWHGIASQIVTPLGSPGPRLPLEARSPAPRRAVWRGLASRIVTPLGSLQAPRKPGQYPPRNIRATVGPGRTAGGIAAGQNLAPAAGQRTPPPVPRRIPARAAIGHGTVAGGIASRVTTPLGQPGPRLPLEARSPAPRRALWRGFASAVVTPLGSPGPKLPPEARSPAPRRALWHGLASAISTPRGGPGPRLPLEARSPAPRRVTWRGLASHVPTPLGSQPSPAPRPVLQHPAPRRVTWHGLASRIVTPLGSPGPRLPLQARSPAPRRATTGPGMTAGGVHGPPGPAGKPVTFGTGYPRTAWDASVPGSQWHDGYPRIEWPSGD